MIKRGVIVAGLSGAQPAMAQSAAPGPGGASAFMHTEFSLLLQAALWLAVGVVALAGLGAGYLLLRWLVREVLATRGFSPEKITALGWILLPLAILAVIMVPAVELLYHSDEPAYVTVNVTAHEWYWEYDYVSVPGVRFVSHVVPDNALRPGEAPGSMADHPLVLPAGEKVQFIVSSADVLHGFFVPPLGVEIYAVPGAMLSGWTIIKKPGVYLGHSSSICGNDHPPMPIEIKAVPLADYVAWARAQDAATQGDGAAGKPGA